MRVLLVMPIGGTDMPVVGLLAPLSLPLVAFATAHSAWCVFRQGGIRRRETFYSLSELRAGTARID